MNVFNIAFCVHMSIAGKLCSFYLHIPNKSHGQKFCIAQEYSDFEVV